MSVYVDDSRIAYGRMGMCYLIADSNEELIDIVDRIGVHRKWIQYPGTAREHFDICLAKRKLAVAAGAIEISRKDLVRKLCLRASLAGPPAGSTKPASVLPE